MWVLDFETKQNVWRSKGEPQKVSFPVLHRGSSEEAEISFSLTLRMQPEAVGSWHYLDHLNYSPANLQTHLSHTPPRMSKTVSVFPWVSSPWSNILTLKWKQRRVSSTIDSNLPRDGSESWWLVVGVIPPGRDSRQIKRLMSDLIKKLLIVCVCGTLAAACSA